MDTWWKYNMFYLSVSIFFLVDHNISNKLSFTDAYLFLGLD